MTTEETFFDTLRDSFETVAAGGLAVVGVAAVVYGVLWAFGRGRRRWRRWRKTPATVQIRVARPGVEGDDTAALASLTHAIEDAYRAPPRDQSGATDVLASVASIDDEQLAAILEIPRAFSEVRARLASAGGLGQLPTVKLSVGGFEIGNAERIWQSLVAEPPLSLTVELGRAAAAVVGRRGGQVVYTDVLSTVLKREAEVVATVGEDIAYMMAGAGGLRYLREGLVHLQEFFTGPHSVRPLEAAREAFGAAARVSDDLRFEAAFLEAVAMQLGQGQPEAVEWRLEGLRQQLGLGRGQQRRRMLIDFNLGQAKFYRYERGVYQEAIDKLEAIERPLRWIWAAGAPLRSLWCRLVSRNEKLRHRYELYWMARATIAIVIPHLPKVEEGDVLDQRAQGIVTAFEAELPTVRQVLERPARIAQLEWRVHNARVVRSLTVTRDPETGLAAAELAIEAAPYALDVRANEGSLYLLAATKSANPAGSPEFAKAAAQFEELGETGWDPGFVQFRLGTIRRVQGRLEEASRLLTAAKDPAIRDVPVDKIDAQLCKVGASNQELAPEDL